MMRKNRHRDLVWPRVPLILGMVGSLLNPGGDQPAPVIATQVIGTGGELNQTNSAATTSTNLKRGGRRRSFLGNAESSEIQLWYAGWTVGTDTGEANIPNALNLQAHIEINGISVAVPFGGLTTPVTLNPGANLISDPVLPAAFGLLTFPRGLEFYIYTEETVAEGGVFPTLFTSAYGTPVPGESYLRADAAATTKIGTSGPLATGGGWVAGNEVWAPFAILGKPVTPMMAVGVIGASIEHGVASATTGDGNSASGGGFCRKALAAVGGSIHIPYVSMARPSEKAATYVSSSANRKLLYPYITHAVCGHGGNDYSSGVTLAANLASNRTIHAGIRTGNPDCHISRLELYIKTDSTNGWIDQDQQTPRTGMETGGAYRDPFNAAMAADQAAGLIDVFSMFAPGVMTHATNLDKWRTDLAATTDGTHPQELVHRAMATAEATRWEALRNTYEAGYTFDTATNTLVAGLAAPPNDTRKKLIDQTIRWLKNSALWDKFDVIGMIGDTQEISLRNWKNPGTNNASLSNATYTADRQFATAGNASSYVETNFNPFAGGFQFTQNSAHFSHWTRSTTSSDSSRSGWFDGTDGVTTVPRSTGGGVSFRINQVNNSTNGGSGGVVDGLLMANRSASNATQVYSNGAAVTVNTNPNQASTALNDHTLRLGVINSSGGIADNYAAWTAGGSLTAVQADIACRAITSYMRKIGAV